MELSSSVCGTLRIPKVYQRICDDDLRAMKDLGTEVKKERKKAVR
jgi:hypothetical protein